MKINNPNGPKGSFGIPEEMREMLEKRKAEKEAKNDEPPVREVEDNMGFEPPVSKVPDNPDDEEEREITDTGPTEVLKTLGITPDEKDFHDLIFRGYVEKTIPITSIPNTNTALTAKVKSLTSDELDMIDELLGEDLSYKRLTKEGLETRRSMWTMAFAILELNGRPTIKPALDKEGKLDKLETAKARRKVLANLNPFVLDVIIKKHAQMVMAFNTILLNPNSSTIKKS